MIVSYFEWVQDLQQLFWTETEVNDKLYRRCSIWPSDSLNCDNCLRIAIGVDLLKGHLAPQNVRAMDLHHFCSAAEKARTWTPGGRGGRPRKGFAGVVTGTCKLR